MVNYNDEEWRNYKLKRLIRKKKYNRSEVPDELNVFYEKKVILDDELLKMIWMIKKQNKQLKNEKQIIKLALKSYLKNIKQD